MQDNNLQNKSEYLNRYNELARRSSNRGSNFKQGNKFYLFSITLNCYLPSIHIVYR